jgi:CHAT domain-containing protein/tetratricopeptide (TPR) repeat protein
MYKRSSFHGLHIIIVIILTGFFDTSSGFGADINISDNSGKNQVTGSQRTANSGTQELANLNLRLLSLISSYNPVTENRSIPADMKVLIDSIRQRILNPKTDSTTISDSYYLIGICNLLSGNNVSAVTNLDAALKIREKTGVTDIRYGRILYNLGIAYRNLGDYYKMEEFELKSLDINKKILGDSNPELIYSYLSLIVAYIELQEYEKAINYSNIALAIAKGKPDVVAVRDMIDLYANLGVCFIRLADFSKAKIYFERAEAIHRENKLDLDINYINLVNSMAITYGALGLVEKSTEYYQNGVALAMTLPVNSSFSFNIVNSYAINLGNSGEAEKGEALLKLALEKARLDKAKSPMLFYEVLSNYAEYLQEYNIDNKKSLDCFAECLSYLDKNPKNMLLRNRVLVGYSLSLAKSGEPLQALELIQDLIEKDYGLMSKAGIFSNPEMESIKADKTSLKIFKTKYRILWDIFKISDDLNILETASQTSEIIISLLDKLRINISEEDSRLILGDKYRDSYFNAIRDFNILYNKTSDNKFLEKAFEYSEKSKVAGLLTSTRELKAVQFQIPPDIAEFEFRLKRDIGTFNILISEEKNKEDADRNLINIWNDKLLKDIRLRDSLILVFERKYPEYYTIRYNTHVVSMDDIPHIIGRDGNYINYVLSDTVLNIFVVNRKYKKILSLPVSSEFYNNIKLFRELLSIPESSDDALTSFQQFQTTGFNLYKILIGPVRSYLISDKLIISPDNILSYIPFETLPSAVSAESRPLYRTIPYLMNDFDVSYTYSATFMAESVKRSYGFSNKVLAFAPNYPEPIDIQTVLKNRQAQAGILNDLPYARQEAQYVTDITGGILYENSEARESVYKKESGKFDIIHLAMHTVLNDKDPMHSTLIFAPEPDSLGDCYLNTYEVYGIPLKAKMVVLSSCNTGNGLLFSGEGVLSLARGFIYSGSQSVVMSMWEIEDRSGTDIVKEFYDNLKKGYPKSSALRRARIDFLRNSDQLRSHPYFWSAMIVYGDNSRLYYNRYMVAGLVLFCAGIIIILLLFYFRKRKYS